MRTGPGKLYYGWIMLGVAVLLAIATMPGQTVVVSIFNASYLAEFEINETALAAAYAAGTILAAFPLSLVGRAADRFGLRRVITVVAISFALSLAGLSQLRLEGLPATIALGVGFFLIRFLGQASMGMLAGHTIAMWFERKLGMVHGVLGIGGFAFGSAVVPIPAAFAISSFGWRTALLGLAGMVVLLTLPPLVFLFRNRPEDVGQHLDGDTFEHAEHDTIHGGRPPANDPAFTLKEALATRAYWIVLASLLVTGMVGTAFLFHMTTLLQAAGLEGSESQVARANVAFPIVFGAGTLIVGWLADRFAPARLIWGGPALMGVSCGVCLAAINVDQSVSGTLTLMAVAMGVFGASMAVTFNVGKPAVARFFGRTHHGVIRGTMDTASVAGTGAGPLLFYLAYDAAGQSFTPILIGIAALCLPLSLLASMVRQPPIPPRHHADSGADRDEPDPPPMV